MPNRVFYDDDVAYLVANGPKSGGKMITVDRLMVVKLLKHTWSINSKGYVHCRDGKDYIKLHHEVIGKPHKGLVVDHINRDPTDNRISNLRIVTYSQNSQNMDLNIWITAWGETRVSTDWMNDPRVLCNHESTVRTRIELGWDHKEALTTPSKFINRFTPEEDEYIVQELSKGIKIQDISKILGRPDGIVGRRIAQNIGWDKVICTEKICTKCRDIKPVSDFYKDKRQNKRLGYSSWCRRCVCEKVKVSQDKKRNQS